MGAKLQVVYVFLLVTVTISTAEISNTAYKLLNKIYHECDASDDIVKCLKIQALKLADRALHANSFKIFDGIYVVRDETARSFSDINSQLSDEKIKTLKSNQIDGLLAETAERFLDSHKVKIDMPRLIEEGRGKMRRYMGALLAAMAVKGAMLAMAMKGIAMMAGMALMIGKMALMMSSIIGLKKLVGGGGGEKTTVEIVKHPQYSYGNSYSSSYEDAGGHYGSSGGGGHGGYHRSLDTDTAAAQERVYNAYVSNKLR